MSLSLENIVPLPELERHGYHELSEEQLRLKDDPEALLERGIRLRYGVGVHVDAGDSRKLIMSSAKLGHPVALALCFNFGMKVTEADKQRAVELLQGSASRGHAAGI